MTEHFRGHTPVSGEGSGQARTESAHRTDTDQHGVFDQDQPGQAQEQPAQVPQHDVPEYEAPDFFDHPQEHGEALNHPEADHPALNYPEAEYAEPGHLESEHAEPDYPEADYTEALPSRRTSRVSKRVRKRRRSLAFLVIVVLFAAVVFFVVQTVKPMLAGFQTPDYPGPGTGSVEFVVPNGATGRSIASELKAADIVASDQAFLNALNDAEGAGSLQPGTFELKSQMKASDAVAVLLDVDGKSVHYAAVAQNLRIGETLAVLADSTGIALSEFEDLSKQPALFGLPDKAKNLEGWLSPGEYRFPIETDAKTVLSELVDKTKTALVDMGVTGPAEQNRILTIASIIEFEGNEANYAKISGAIENRINNPNGETGGRLESDATVAYGLGKKTYNITAAEKADKTNLYNTFANPGLPVGPIGSPGIKAIEAAAHPEANPYYFWVTINLDTGETLYAATFAEHQVNVAKYVAWCGENPGKCE